MQIASSVAESPRSVSLGEILQAHWPIKFLSPVIGLTAFFIVYFWVQNHLEFAVTLMPMTAFDRAIGFHPWSLVLYATLWVYILIPSSLMVSKRELTFYYIGVVVLAVLGLGIFVLWPTATPAPNIDWARYSGFSFLKRIDSSGNACPSLHAAFSIFTAMWNLRMLRRLGDRGLLRVLSTVWCVGILYSTLATKQHVLVDLLGGSALGLFVALIHMQMWRGRNFTARVARRFGMFVQPASQSRDDLE